MRYTITVRQTINGKPVHTRFNSEDAASRYAASVGGKVLPVARGTLGVALQSAIRTMAAGK